MFLNIKNKHDKHQVADLTFSYKVSLLSLQGGTQTCPIGPRFFNAFQIKIYVMRLVLSLKGTPVDKITKEKITDLV